MTSELAVVLDDFAAPGGRAGAPAGYQRLLDDFVRVVRVDDQTIETRFDYAALHSAPDRDARLDSILTTFRQADMAAMSEGERRAFAVNAYNAHIIAIVTEALELPGGRLESIMEIGGGGGAVFDAPRLANGDRLLSPNAWERQVVLAGDEPDPRTHFAVNCASLGCPSLMPVAFDGARLDAQLDAATRNALRNPRFLRIDREHGRLRASPLFSWYASDFGGDAGVIDFLIRHAPTEMVRFIESEAITAVDADLEWDWGLNIVSAASRSSSSPSSSSSSSPGRPLHTYSIVARDPATGELGVAVESHWFSVGPVVPWAEAGVGAVATQSLVDVTYGPLGLELMRAGRSAPEALAALITADSLSAVRQVAMVDAAGRVAAHTGTRCIASAGHATGAGYSVQANLMVDDTIWPAMAAAYESATGDLAERLLAALEAAQARGGDIRGRQSAALLVVAGEASGRPWEDRLVDLRVEDHPAPVVELRRLLGLHRAYEHMDRGDVLIGEGKVEEALAAYTAAVEMVPDIVELPYWQAVTLAGSGLVEEALPIFRQVFEREPAWIVVTRRLVDSGFLPDDPELLARIMAVAPDRR